MQRLAATAWSLLLGLALCAAPASAQQLTPVQPAPAQPAVGQPAVAQPAPAQAEPAAQPPQAPVAQAPVAQAPAPRIVLPIVVISLPDRSVAAPVALAIRDAIVAGLAPSAGGRPVVALPDEARIAAIASCHDAICTGARLAELQAMTGVIVRATRRNRLAPVDVRVEMLDPVSGAGRLAAPVAVQVPVAAEGSPAATLAAMIAQLVPAMPSPPPPPATLLIVTNVDDALVTVDGREVGHAPIAPIELPQGRYNVVVTVRGWRTSSRMVQVPETGAQRADFDLEPEPETLSALESARGWSGGGGSSGGSGGGAFDGGVDSSEDSTPLYARWYVIGGAAAVVVATVVIIAVAASSGGTEVGPPAGIPIPPIQAP